MPGALSPLSLRALNNTAILRRTEHSSSARSSHPLPRKTPVSAALGSRAGQRSAEPGRRRRHTRQRGVSVAVDFVQRSGGRCDELADDANEPSGGGIVLRWRRGWGGGRR